MSFRNLEVPYFSQRENKCIWIEKYPLDSKIIDADGNAIQNWNKNKQKPKYIKCRKFDSRNFFRIVKKTKCQYDEFCQKKVVWRLLSEKVANSFLIFIFSL